MPLHAALKADIGIGSQTYVGSRSGSESPPGDPHSTARGHLMQPFHCLLVGHGLHPDGGYRCMRG